MLSRMRKYYGRILAVWLVAMALIGNYLTGPLRTPVLTLLVLAAVAWSVGFIYLDLREIKQRAGQKLKMYCICSKEALDKMKGIRGKMITQGGHAYLHAFWDAETRFPALASAYQNGTHAYKITLVVPTEDDLIRLQEAYRDRTGVSLVRDAGFTVFKNPDGSPNPTITYLGVGPIYDGDVDTDISDLKTLT